MTPKYLGWTNLMVAVTLGLCMWVTYANISQLQLFRAQQNRFNGDIKYKFYLVDQDLGSLQRQATNRLTVTQTNFTVPYISNTITIPSFDHLGTNQ